MYSWVVLYESIACFTAWAAWMRPAVFYGMHGIRDIDTHPPTPITYEDIIALAKRHDYFISPSLHRHLDKSPDGA